MTSQPPTRMEPGEHQRNTSFLCVCLRRGASSQRLAREEWASACPCHPRCPGRGAALGSGGFRGGHVQRDTQLHRRDPASATKSVLSAKVTAPSGSRKQWERVGGGDTGSGGTRADGGGKQRTGEGVGPAGEEMPIAHEVRALVPSAFSFSWKWRDWAES